MANEALRPPVPSFIYHSLNCSSEIPTLRLPRNISHDIPKNLPLDYIAPILSIGSITPQWGSTRMIYSEDVIDCAD